MNKLLVFFISAVLLFGCAKKTEAPVQAPAAEAPPAPPAEAPPAPAAEAPPAPAAEAPPAPAAEAPPAPPAAEAPAHAAESAPRRWSSDAQGVKAIEKLSVHFSRQLLTNNTSEPATAAQQAQKSAENQVVAATTKNAFDVIDEQLKKMSFGNIAFNTPKTINIDSTKTIQLKLDLKKSIDELKNTINSQEGKAGAQIKVSNQMEARLTGQNFSITPLTPETQAISSNETTEWMWRVKPTAEGTQDLNLTLSAILDVNGKAMPRKVEVFVKVIEVKVTAYQKIQLFVEKNWQWLWATLVIPIAGWLWKKKK